MVKGSEGVFFNYLGNIVKPNGGEYWSILRISMCEDLEKPSSNKITREVDRPD